KIDVFSGEILLGTALRKQSEGTRAAYVRHLKIAYDEDAPEVDRAASFLYLAMEADAACEYIKAEAPGFTEYAYARARKYVSDVGSELLQDGFLNGNADPGYKFAALIREFDTFRSQPLDYGDFEGVLQNIVEQVRSLPDSESRLEAARQLAHYYLVKQGGPIDMDLLAEMLSSADMLGKNNDADKFPEESDGNSNDGFNKPQNPSKILQEKLFDGRVDKIPVRLETNVSAGYDDNQARKLYE